MRPFAIRSLREVKRLEITFVTDNYSDALRPDTAVGTRYRTAPGASIHAEHGLSCFVRTHTDRGTFTFMFDFGLDGRGVHNNMSLLNIDPSRIDALGLSHGHFDHWGGLLDILKELRTAAAGKSHSTWGKRPLPTGSRACPNMASFGTSGASTGRQSKASASVSRRSTSPWKRFRGPISPAPYGAPRSMKRFPRSFSWSVVEGSIMISSSGSRGSSSL